MRWIIEAEGVKREMPSSFAVCASVRDLEWLAKKFAEAALLLRHSGDANYGWQSVHADSERVPDTAPLPWSER